MKTEMLPPFCPKRPHFHLAVTTAVEAAPRAITIMVLIQYSILQLSENVYVPSVSPRYKLDVLVQSTSTWPLFHNSIGFPNGSGFGYGNFLIPRVEKAPKISPQEETLASQEP